MLGPMDALGPFVLGELLGTGGMGRVYRARHAELGVEVAIKALVARDPEVAAQRLRTEVEAMARLDHPHIGRVFDHGVATGGALGRGTPWFAMELLRSDLSQEVARARHWSVVSPFVMQLLDALAHAHAHGVIHRDLKASNVLVGRSDDQRPGLKLVDFGIAAVGHGSARHAGTPSAMAPEQWSRDLSGVGPWTDVYGLGTLIWRLVTGARPTGDASGPGIYLRQKDEAFEAFLPRYPVPEGLEAWLRTAMAFRPSERFACCADAKRALVACGAMTERLPDELLGRVPVAVERTDSSHVTVPATRWEADLPSTPTRPAPPAAEVPRHWREPLPPPASLHLAGVGRSLLSWREVPFVGREEARDTLWQATRRGMRSRKLVRVAITGPDGVGGSALGRWWVQRLRTSSGSIAGIADADLQGLVDHLLQPLGTPGDHEGRRRGLEQWRADFRAAVDALDALSRETALDLQVGAVLEVLRALGRVRPVALFVDATSPGVARLLERSAELEAGVVLVARVKSVPEGWEELALRPMPYPELSLVLDQLLPLERTLHRAVVEGAGGLPARLRTQVLQLLPQLVPARDGFTGPLPRMLGADPLGLVEDLGEVDLELLEVGAIGGETVLRAVWVRAAGVPPRVADDLAERLLRRGVAQPMPSGFVLPPELAAALRRRADAAGRGAGHRRATARALEHLRGDPLGIGRLWLDAGEVARGAQAILDGWGRMIRLHGARVALGVTEELQERLAAVPEREALHGRAVAFSLDLRQELGHIEREEAVALEAWARSRGWYDIACRAVRLHARVVTADQPAVNAVYEGFERDGLGRCSVGYQARMLAAWYLRLERFADPRRDDVLERVRAAAGSALAVADEEERAYLEHLLASVERTRLGRDGDPDQQVEVARSCVERARAFAAAPLILDLGELGHALRRAGRLDEADRAFEEAARTARWMRIARAEAFSNGNRAGLAGLRGEWVRAAELAQRALVGADHPYLKAVLELICAVPLARAERFAELEGVLRRLEPTLAKVRPIDVEVTACLEAIEQETALHAPGVAARARSMMG